MIVVLTWVRLVAAIATLCVSCGALAALTRWRRQLRGFPLVGFERAALHMGELITVLCVVIALAALALGVRVVLTSPSGPAWVAAVITVMPLAALGIAAAVYRTFRAGVQLVTNGHNGH